MFISSTGDMRPVQLDQIESVEEHAGIMPALSDTTERRDAQLRRKERWPLRQHRPHRLRPYWAPAGVGASSRQLSSQRGYAGTQVCCSESAPDALSLTLLTVLTVLTVFSGHERIRITLLPARPSRLNANFDTEYPKERLSGRRGIRARCAVGPKR